MSHLEKLRQDIQDQLDGIKVQWQMIVRETDPTKRSNLKKQVFVNMDDVGTMMREYFEALDNA